MDIRTEKMGKLAADVKVIFELAKAEGRELSADEYAKKDSMLAEFNGLKKTLDAEKQAAEMHFTSDVITGKAVEAKQNEREEFNAFLRSGDRSRYVITTGTGSGALVPVAVSTPVIVRRAWNAYLNAAVIGGQPVLGGTSTETLSLPVMDDTTVSGQAEAEDATSDTAADPVTTNISLGANLYDSKTVWISNTQAQAVGYDLAGYVLPILDKRIELSQGAAWHTKAVAHAVSGNTVTTAATNGLTYAEFIKFYHKIAVQFRTDAVWIISDGLLQILESLTDTYGRPLLSDPLTEGAVKTLKGRPVVIDINMADPAANAISGMIVSAASLHPRIIENRRVAVYQNVPTAPDQMGYREFVNGDFDVSAGMAFLKGAAS